MLTVTMETTMDETNTFDNFDREIGSLTGLPGVTSTKPSTVRVTTPLVGNAQTFIVQTFRQREGDEDESAGPAKFSVFIEHVDRGKATRVVLPPAVADLIMRQRDSLTTRARSASAKRVMAKRKERGDVLGFQKRKA